MMTDTIIKLAKSVIDHAEEVAAFAMADGVTKLELTMIISADEEPHTEVRVFTVPEGAVKADAES